MTQKFNSKTESLKNIRQADSSVLPVSLSDIKNFMRYEETSLEEDSLITTLIKTAWRIVEKRTNRVLISETYKLYLDFMPSEYIQLPVSEVSSITSVKYYDENNSLQTLSSSLYDVDLNRIDPRIYTENYTMPSVYDKRNAVEIEYVAGAASSSAIPQPLRHAVMLMVAHWFKQRSITTETQQYMVPDMVDTLLELYTRKHF